MEKFYLGMDIGTNSVGMACTDERYKLLRGKGQDLWSVRLFDGANPAAERRAKRTARRRLQRRRQRIEFLQGIFAPYMQDDLFFIRLNNSGFYSEDKDERLKTRFSLFSDKEYTDMDFYREYPTIFHLRQALINGEKLDLRFYYLAIHHVIKYRGHFLFEGSIDAVHDIVKLFKDFNEVVDEAECERLHLLEEKAEDFKNIALSHIGLSDKKKQANQIFDATKNSALKELLALLLGSKAKASDIFHNDNDEYDDEPNEKYKDISLCFKGLTDEEFLALQDDFTDEHYELLQRARAIYNYSVFEKVLNGNQYISQSMIALYEKHNSDLKLLKRFVRANYPHSVYYDIFRKVTVKEGTNYVSYIGYTQTSNKKINVTKCKPDEFFAFLKKRLTSNVDEAVKNDEDYKYVMDEIENGTFLPKILNADNGLFPRQINEVELDKILDNLCKYYPEFEVKDEEGYAPKAKIKSIFTFKIPYYVGPLNTFHKENSWMVRKKQGKITPWNFDETVDKEKSNEGFIRRMTNKCTYLHNQDVLPKNSMYYQAYDVLNQINKLKINGDIIGIELKQKIFNDLFLRNKKVTVKNIANYLIANGKYKKEELKKDSITGINGEDEITASMSAYVTFKNKLGSFVDEHPEIIEDIILLHTLNSDKNLLEEILIKKYADQPVIIENIKWIKSLTAFKEFGRLSKKLIAELRGIDKTTGEYCTILEKLHKSDCNFMELIHSPELTFSEEIQKENSGESSEVTYDDIAETYVSPMVRRGIWQALKMADEYVTIVGKIPDKIFIEVTRFNGEKNKTVPSRKKRILELYKGLGKDCEDIDRLVSELNRDDMTDLKLRQDRLYLYFLQLGRCAYTGRPIKLEQLATDLYDVDHIVPQSLDHKENGIDNKVLVERTKNAQKSNIYPLPIGFTDQKPFWTFLKNKEFMSKKKYDALTRTEPLSEKDFRDFVARQLVITAQTAKAVAELLQRKYGDQTTVVYSKAEYVDRFKQNFDIVKCRETNDLHHARDAYLNIVVGNCHNTKFSSARDYHYRDFDGVLREYALRHLFDKPIKGAWDGAQSLELVKNTVKKTSMKVTRYAFTGQGEFYDQTVYKKDDKGIAVPRKDSAPYNQTEKYGGYKSLNTAYFTIVKSKDKKGKAKKTIEAIPVLIDYKSKTNKNAVIDYLLKIGLIEPEILISKLKNKALVSVNGYRVWIAGATGKQILLHNAEQWFTDSKTDLYVKQLAKLCDLVATGKLSDEEKQKDCFEMIASTKGVKLSVNREQNVELYELIINTFNKNVYRGLQSIRSFAEKITSKKEIFIGLSVLEQAKVLLEIINVLKCNAENADLSLLQDGSTCGKIRISQNITDVDFAIIHQSPCGTIERVQKV